MASSTCLQGSLLAICRLSNGVLFSAVCALKIFSMACVASKFPFYSVSPSNFHSVRSFQVVFMSYVAFRFLFCLCHLQVSFLGVCCLQVVFTECVAFQLAVSGVCCLYSSFMVSFVFCSPLSFIACVACKFSWPVSPSSCFHGVCRLQVSTFLALDAFRLVFTMCIALIF